MRRQKHSRPCWNRMVLAGLVVGLCLVQVETVGAATASASTSKVYRVDLCGGLICFPLLSTYTSLVEVNYYSAGKDEPYHVVYWQKFNATDKKAWYTLGTACRPRDLYLKNAYYNKGDWAWTSNVPIGGWSKTFYSVTKPETIVNYYSPNDYALTCTNGTCFGVFIMNVKMPKYADQECLPNLAGFVTEISF